MASDLAPPPRQIPQHDEMESSLQPSAPSILETTVNGDHEPTTSSMDLDGLVKGGSITANEDHIPPTDIDTSIPDVIPTGPRPVEQVDSGIAPVADFIPKDAATTSHPTPPPDEPLITGSADVDVVMANVEADEQVSVEPETSTLPLPSYADQSLVRPREDDEEDEPAAKRTRVEEISLDVPAEESVLPDAPVLEQVIGTEIVPVPEPAVEDSIEPSVENISEGVIESIPEAVVEPLVERIEETIVEPATEPLLEQALDAVVPPIDDGVKVEDLKVDTRLTDVPIEPVVSTGAVATVSEIPVAETPAIETPIVETPMDISAPASAILPTQPAAEPAEKPVYPSAPMTSLQKNSLIEKMKNLKKTKNSVAFLKPVDYVALNIPTYPEIVANPMDLSTMESKLKEGKYASVQDLANDFDLIIGNARRFNGDAHPVTQAGYAMEAYFRRMMETVPGPEQQAPVKAEKRSPSIATEKPRREPRQAAQPAPVPPPPAPVPAVQSEAFALQADGTPQIRRQSSLSNRPARAIKPPQNREIAYSKPKRKEHQLELKFCENLLDELRGPKYATMNHVFLYPVDPVALNIPNYRSIVKHPMDLSTMSQKLKSGQYANATEFKKDFELIIENCLAFNPLGNPVRDLGIQFQRQFEELWQNKEKWERKNQPADTRASSASAEDESGAEEEEEEEEEDGADDKATIRALQKQLAEMQNALSGLGGDKPVKSKKTAKPAKAPTKKSVGSMSSVPAKKAAAAAKPAPKSKKTKVVTYEEKQEISEAVNKMDEKQVGRLTEIITQNCAKYRDMEEMELEIDDLPNDVQVMLLEYVRRLFGNPNKKKAREPSPDDAAALDDDDYEEKGGARGGKRKKHRPMGKKEQQETINSIKNKLAQFSQAATSGSESPTNSSFNAANAQAETSGDEESEESEEE